MPPLSSSARADRGGYAMLIALILLAVIAIVGATSLSVAGTDVRVATHNRRHMMVVNAADAGTAHARWELQAENPANEGWDTADTGNWFVDMPEGDVAYQGIDFPMNQGMYRVKAVYQKCSNPPPGYSTEQGNTSFHSDYWDMQSDAWFGDETYAAMNATEASVVAQLRKVNQGDCKIR